MNTINIIAQAFYGNRVATEVSKDRIDSFILGYMDGEVPSIKSIDRTIIHVPNADGIVIVYNKHEEERNRELKDRALKEANYVMKPLAVIPEENIELYGRCIACRMNAEGELVSLQEGDFEKLTKYLAK